MDNDKSRFVVMKTPASFKTRTLKTKALAKASAFVLEAPSMKFRGEKVALANASLTKNRICATLKNTIYDDCSIYILQIVIPANTIKILIRDIIYPPFESG